MVVHAGAMCPVIPCAPRKATVIFGCNVRTMREIKEFWKLYSPYFLDIWQYLVILLVVIIAAIVIL